MDSSKRERYIFTACLVGFFLTIALCHYVFWTYDSLYGVGDIRNYQNMYLNHEFDQTHWMLVVGFNIFGFEPMLIILTSVMIPFAFYYYFRSYSKTLIALFFSQYLMYMQVGFYSQILSFFFFLLYIKNEKTILGLIGCLAHPTFSIAYFIHDLFKKRYSYAFVWLIIGLIFYINWFPQYREYNPLNVGAKTSYYTEPSYLDTIFFMNPFLLTYSLSPHYILFFILSIIFHNGRMGLFFIPYLIDGYRGKNLKIMLLYGFIFSLISLIAPFKRII
jgi:hypothetical protein